jgi:hypothetical protein
MEFLKNKERRRCSSTFAILLKPNKMKRNVDRFHDGNIENLLSKNRIILT